MLTIYEKSYIIYAAKYSISSVNDIVILVIAFYFIVLHSKPVHHPHNTNAALKSAGKKYF